MTTTWNYVWGESWKEYIQRKSITDDLTQAGRESARAMVGAISDQTRSILTGMESSARTVSDRIGTGFGELGLSLDRGFESLREQMGDVAGEISGLNSTFEWGFGHVLASLGDMGDSLKSLIKTAKTPTQTAAYEHFEIARDAFRRRLYPECLDALEKAVNGDRTTSGYKLEWRFHRLLGVIRLGFAGCDMSLIDLPRAEEEFLLAARYARNDAPKEAALNMLQAGWAAYVQDKSREALAHTEEAIALDSRLAEAKFQAAKFMVSKTSMGRSLQMLKGAIELEPSYVIKASADGEFQQHENDLNDFFSVMRAVKFNTLAPRVRAALAEAEEQAQTVIEVKLCSDIFKRWRNLLDGNWGLLDLLTYERKMGQDQQSVREAFALGTARIAKEREDRKRAEREMRAKVERERRELEERTTREVREERERAETERLERERRAAQAHREMMSGLWSALWIIVVIGCVIGVAAWLISALGIIGWLIVIVFGSAFAFDTIF